MRVRRCAALSRLGQWLEHDLPCELHQARIVELICSIMCVEVGFERSRTYLAVEPMSMMFVVTVKCTERIRLVTSMTTRTW